MPAPIQKKAAKILPDEILREIVSYVPGKTTIYKNGYKELYSRITEENFHPNMRGHPLFFCSFRHGKNKLKTPAAMTFEDPWYGTCHLMMLNRPNKNNHMEFLMTKWAGRHPWTPSLTTHVGQRFHRRNIFFYFPNGWYSIALLQA
jgi:hypothetical protein